VNCHGNYGEMGLQVCDVESFSSFDLLTRALHVAADRIDGNRGMATRIGNIMHRMGWKKRRITESGERIYRYFRPRAAKALVRHDLTDATGGPDADHVQLLGVPGLQSGAAPQAHCGV
jgi:hypothetical protein